MTTATNENVIAALSVNQTTPPRGFHERDAAKYIGMSISFLRKDRMYGALPGRTPGPRWARVGKRVIYLKEDLDTWLDTHVVHGTGGECPGSKD